MTKKSLRKVMQEEFLRRITAEYIGRFHCVNCLYSFRTKNKLQSDKRLCENKDFYGILMPSEVTKILEFNQYKTSDKPPSIIYANLESLIENR